MYAHAYIQIGYLVLASISEFVKGFAMLLKPRNFSVFVGTLICIRVGQKKF